MKKLGLTLLLILIIYKVINDMHILPFPMSLEIMFGIVIVLLIINYIISSSKKRKEQKLVAGINAYFETHSKIVVNDVVSIRKDTKHLTSLRDLIIYYEKDGVCYLGEYVEHEKEDYQKIIGILSNLPSELDFIDVNNNGIDDREEVLNQAEFYYNKIYELKNYCKHEEIDNGLNEIIAHLKHIQLLESKYPDITSKLDKLYEKYLPILVTILTNYGELYDTHPFSEQLKLAEEKLSKTIFLVNEAIVTMKTSLVQSDIIDLKTDMSVLEMVLKMDGLITDEMAFSKRRD